MIKVTYEVFRFKKWWKSEWKIEAPDFIKDYPKSCKDFLEAVCHKRDLWEIRNLKY